MGNPSDLMAKEYQYLWTKITLICHTKGGSSKALIYRYSQR